MKIDKLNEKWIAVNGSIFTERGVEYTSEHDVLIKNHHESIAFNVGHRLAQHIVFLHNMNLASKDKSEGPPEKSR